MSTTDISLTPREEVYLGSFEVCDDGCWVWTGRRNPVTGYGMAGQRYAHRFVYERSVGEIPEGLTIDHLCSVKDCVNPDHLEPVSLAVNVLRSTNPFAINARKTHCKFGHEFSTDNTKVLSEGGRQCIECARRRSRETYKRRVAAGWDRRKKR